MTQNSILFLASAQVNAVEDFMLASAAAVISKLVPQLKESNLFF